MRVLLVPPLVLACVLAWVLVPARADGPPAPYPQGESVQDIEGLKVWLHVPQAISANKPASMVVILHGAGGTASGMAGALRAWPKDGYVVVAPKSKGQVWEASDLVAVQKIAAHIKAVMPIDPDKVHVVGFSNGGWNLHTIAFDGDLKPVTATWVAAGFRSGSVPQWAEDRLAAMAIAGAQDGNVGAARETVPTLHEKVRSVEVRVQENLGHSWPDKEMDYLRWWMGVMEGRFTVGDDRSFAWGTSVSEAVETLKNQKKGGILLYVYDPKADVDKPEAKMLQNEVFHDLDVRHYGRQLEAVKLEWPAAQAELELRKIKLKETPAVVVLKRDGKIKKVLQGKIKARKLASALKSVAPDRSKPLDD